MNALDTEIGYTQYVIDISDDREGGHYFDIFRIQGVAGEAIAIKECLVEAEQASIHPFKSREDAIEAAKHWLREHKQGDLIT